MMSRANEIRNFILKHIATHPEDIVTFAAAQFGVTRVTTHRHLNLLIQSGKVIKSGTTRGIKYFLPSQLDQNFTFKIDSKLSEFYVWQNHFDKIFKEMPENISNICHYGFTEMLNNAIEHSEGEKITIHSSMMDNDINLTIKDDGIGIFRKLANNFLLDDFRESILQLSIGKMTTDPKNHTGEGVFFTSRAFDHFEIISNNFMYKQDNIENDWSLQNIKTIDNKGTCISMRINQHSSREMVDVFKRFQDAESLEFDRTEITVALSKFDTENFISRSQAKRILRNLDKFKKVMLDFKGVRLVGQGFVDQVFRVYANEHPRLSINYTNATPDVKFMIERGLAVKRSQEGY